MSEYERLTSHFERISSKTWTKNQSSVDFLPILFSPSRPECTSPELRWAHDPSLSVIPGVCLETFVALRTVQHFHLTVVSSRFLVLLQLTLVIIAYCLYPLTLQTISRVPALHLSHSSLAVFKRTNLKVSSLRCSLAGQQQVLFSDSAQPIAVALPSSLNSTLYDNWDGSFYFIAE